MDFQGGSECGDVQCNLCKLCHVTAFLEECGVGNKSTKKRSLDQILQASRPSP